MKVFRAPVVIGASALIAGTAAAIMYARAGLTLSHFDARAHLVVARRILDSLTPGWQQIGAVWLPLPHLLNMLPVQVDSWYRSGASGVALSVLSTGLTAWAITRLILLSTGSIAGGAAAAALFVTNPNLLYIQSTPMTEPLLFATAFVALALLGDWIQRGTTDRPTAAGLALAALCMTRYEGWIITCAAILVTASALLRRGEPWSLVLGTVWQLALFPAIAIVIFTLNSRWTIGYWFIPRDFFVPENTALGDPSLAWSQVRESVHQLSNRWLVWGGYAGAAGIAAAFFLSRRRAPLALLLSIAAAGALPWYAYLQGHPVRVRYGLPLVAACAALSGAGIALLWKPVRWIAAVSLVSIVIWQTSPMDRTAVLVIESQRDAPNVKARRAITRYLLEHYRGDTPIMISMGSLAHYMQELGQAGFDLHSILHEGNGEAWRYAVLGPGGYVNWVVIEEGAEGGDALSHAFRRDPRYLDGFERVAEGGGAALYRYIRTADGM
jgi:hypothetical protein